MANRMLSSEIVIMEFMRHLAQEMGIHPDEVVDIEIIFVED